MKQAGKYAFIVGLVLSFAAAFITQAPWMYWAIAVLGLIVGFLNVTAEESQGFLLAAIALVLSATSILAIPIVGVIVTAIVANVVAFIAPAVLVVSLKVLLETAKD